MIRRSLLIPVTQVTGFVDLYRVSGGIPLGLPGNVQNPYSLVYLMKLLLNSLLLVVVTSALAQEIVVPSETASRETLRLSAEQSTLRLGGLDLFPHAAGMASYDDNILISHTGQMDDVVWTFSPGLTLAAGDVGAYLPGSVTLEQLRALLYYSTVDDVSKPSRFFALDYTPSFNVYTHHSENDNTAQSARFSGAYAFTRLSLGLDADFTQEYVKDAGVGDLLEVNRYDTYLRSRYDLSDRTSLEINGLYNGYQYAQSQYQGYNDVKNEDWLNRKFADRLSLGVGLGFGFAFPEASPDQTYQQLLARAVYRLSGKLYFSSALGVELREYGSGQSDTVKPIFSVAGTYEIREGTTLTLEAHRRDTPSFTAGQNVTDLGAMIGARQRFFGRLFASAYLGYDYYEYATTAPGGSTSRADNYFFGRLRFDYEFNRHVTGSLFYTYYRDNSSYDIYSFNDNVVGLQVAWRL